MLKYIIAPVALFLVATSAAFAFNGTDWSSLGLNLSDSQISALDKAQSIRQKADEEAKTVLQNAGIDEDTMRQIHDAQRSAMQKNHEAVESAVESGDYNAFVAAVAGTPLADKITSEADFNKFVEAHNLRKSGDTAGAEKIMSELGIERPMGGPDGHRGPGGMGHQDNAQNQNS